MGDGIRCYYDHVYDRDAWGMSWLFRAGSSEAGLLFFARSKRHTLFGSFRRDLPNTEYLSFDVDF